MLHITGVPIRTGAYSLIPYSKRIETEFTKKDRFGEPYTLLQKVQGSRHTYLKVPREFMSLGETDLRAEGISYTFSSNVTPRNDNQVQLIAQSKKLLSDRKSFIMQADTGVGKTVIATVLIAHVGKKTLIVLKKDLDQWKDELLLHLDIAESDIGLIQADNVNIKDKKIVLASVQSISKLKRYDPKIFADFGFVIFDEVHSIGAEHFSNAAWLVPALLRLGLSATPDRADGRINVIKGHIGEILVKSTIANMPYKVIRVPTAIRLPRVKVLDSVTGEVEEQIIPHSGGKCGHVNKILANNKRRNDQIVQFVDTAFTKGRFIILLTETRAHIDILTTALNSFGILPEDIGYFMGGRSKKQIEQAKTRHIALGTYKYCAEGLNVPHWDTLVMCTPRSDVRQIVGRILREHPNKKEPVVFDLIDRDSPLFLGYSETRLKYYKKRKATIIDKR